MTNASARPGAALGQRNRNFKNQECVVMASRCANQSWLGVSMTLAVSLQATLAIGQCTLDWRPGQSLPGVEGLVYASATWDPDGLGPQTPLLIVSGSLSSAGGMSVGNIAGWNGMSWNTLGAGLNGTVYALAAFDDGTPGAPAAL